MAEELKCCRAPPSPAGRLTAPLWAEKGFEVVKAILGFSMDAYDAGGVGRWARRQRDPQNIKPKSVKKQGNACTAKIFKGHVGVLALPTTWCLPSDCESDFP